MSSADSPAQLVSCLAAEGLEVLARATGAHGADVARLYPRLNRLERVDGVSRDDDGPAAFPAGEAGSYGDGGHDILALADRGCGR